MFNNIIASKKYLVHNLSLFQEVVVLMLHGLGFLGQTVKKESVTGLKMC